MVTNSQHRHSVYTQTWQVVTQSHARTFGIMTNLSRLIESISIVKHEIQTVGSTRLQRIVRLLSRHFLEES